MTVVGAYRIENTDIWNRYVMFRNTLRKKLRSEGKTSFPNFSDVSKGKGVMTMAVLEDMIDMEDVLSLENFDADLNECLLWHGTSQKAVDKIVANDFIIPR